jgi:hypothetical protein
MNLQERALLLQAAEDNPELQQAHLRLCKLDILYWFHNFCWTFNPRQAPYDFPFVLYPFQENLVLLIKECIDTGEPLLIKKSRDMGVTWLVLLVFQYYWLFEDGSDFHLTSRKEDEIDKKGSKSTLFEKLRYNTEWLPPWMNPPIGRNDDAFMKLVNPLNGNSITGEAPVVDFARSQRYKAIMMDEAARLPYGEASYASASHSTNSIIMPYTPYGKGNLAYNLFKGPDIQRVKL